jgi:hypothetical protein
MITRYIKLAPPYVNFDPHMVEDDGLVPALARHVRGFSQGPIAVGQEVRACDEEGRIFEAIVARIEGGTLLLEIVSSSPPHDSDAPAFFVGAQPAENVTTEATGETRDAAVDPSQWIVHA